MGNVEKQPKQDHQVVLKAKYCLWVDTDVHRKTPKNPSDLGLSFDLEIQ